MPGKRNGAGMLMLLLLTAATGHSAEADVREFVLRHGQTGRIYGLYAYTNGAPVLNGRGVLCASTGLSFRIKFLDRGVSSTCGPFAFTNGAPVRLGEHDFRLITRGLYDVREELARQAEVDRGFADAQRAKGLVEYGGAWVTTNALRAAREGEAARQAGERRMAAIPPQARCLRCGGTGMASQGTETGDGLAISKYGDCPACKGDGRSTAAASPPPATTALTNPAPSPVGTAADTPRKITPMGFKKPGGNSGSGGVRRLGE